MPNTVSRKTTPGSSRRARASAYSSLPRLAVPRGRGKIIRRHFRRSVVRLLTVLAADLVVLIPVVWVGTLLLDARAVRFDAPVFAVLFGLFLSGCYGRSESWRSLSRVVGGVGVGVLIAGWGAFSGSPVQSTGPLTLVWLAVAAPLAAARWLLGSVVDLLKRRMLAVERVLLAGADEESLEQAQALVASRNGVKVVERIALAPGTDLWEILTRAKPDTVVVAGELSAIDFADLVRATTLSGCYLLSVSRNSRPGALRPRVVWWNGTPLTELTLPELTAPQLAIKRAVDLSGALVGLIVLAPLFLVIAAWIRATSAGPVLFRQTRIGFGGRLFLMYKFRTMRADADRMKHDLAHLNASGDPRLFKIPDDPRITGVGRILRRWSLDEFPQLINVLKGEMSLVGPRPFFEDDLEDYREEHFSRMAAKPGMTGLWQVRGRSAILDFEEVVRLDLEYIDRWSLLRDLQIILQTVPAVLRRAGAE